MKYKYLLATDIDNTLLYSYKYKKDNDICIEMLNGEKQGFCSATTLELLKDISDKVLVVPITSRSIEQYERIEWPQDIKPAFAVVANGAILMADNNIDMDWYNNMRAIIQKYSSEFDSLQKYVIEKYKCKCKIIDDSFIVIITESVDFAIKVEVDFLSKTKMEVVRNGRKVYLFPKGLNKGTALEMLKEKFHCDKVFSAGDSNNDIDMLMKSDYAFVPYGSEIFTYKCDEWGIINHPEESFSEFMLKKIKEICNI